MRVGGQVSGGRRVRVNVAMGGLAVIEAIVGLTQQWSKSAEREDEYVSVAESAKLKDVVISITPCSYI